jgi:hypothetical protein
MVNQMILKKASLFILLLTGIFGSVYAQRDTVSLNTIIAKTTKLASDYPIEKAYLHLDKPYYAAGDTIWFKAYLTIDKHQPSTLSSVVYVDITNNRDSVMQTLKLPVTNSVANGNIILTPAAYTQGNYHLRAYTAWMRNFDPDYYFNKNITIGNAINSTVKTNVVFNSTPADGRIKVDADITYNEPGEIKLANKRVSWTVIVNDSEVSKGKGTTNANGVLSVSFTGINPPALKTGVLNTVIDLGDNRTVTNTFSLQSAIGTKDVQFFPEGGELINGVRSKVAFKAINTNGLGVSIKGTVTDNTGATVATIESQHLGMGTFVLTPEEGKSYKANITFADGSKASYYLPRALPSGINLAISNTDPENLNIRISTNTAFFQANLNKPFYIVAQVGGAIYYAANTTLQTQVYSAAIPKTKFPTGIIQFTLLSAYGSPLSERLVFIQRNDALNLTLTTDRKIYTTRQNVKVAVSAKNKTLPVAGNFSVSVIDETKTPYDENNETTILSNLLLTSDLKGYIEKPNYYFLPKNATASDDLDVLMLTQGYRRISYSNIVANKKPQLFLMPEQNGIEISGMLRNNTGLPIAKGNLRLQIPGKASVETTTDMTGNFKFTNLNFRDSSQLVVNARNNVNSKNLVITLNGESVQLPSPNAYVNDEVVNIDSAFKPYLQNSKTRYDNLRILKEVVIKSTVTKRAGHTQFPALTGLPAEADQTIDKERLQGCGSLLTCLPSLALGITVDNNLFYITRNYNSGNKKPMAIFVDGKPVDAPYLASVTGDAVESIETFKTDGVSGLNNIYGTSGIIAITMKKVNKTKISLAQLQEMMPPPNVVTFMPFGYAPTREFYSPRYTVAKPAGANNDLRTTIYWNPKVITDKTGITSFDFFNADGRGTYRATIEGIDADGNLGRYILRYTVK